jgi:hypothetical protein
VEKWKVEAECLEEKIIYLTEQQKDVVCMEEVEKIKEHEVTMTIHRLTTEIQQPKHDKQCLCHLAHMMKNYACPLPCILFI